MHGLKEDERLVDAIFEKAKASDHLLSDEEVEAIVRTAAPVPARARHAGS